MVILTGLHVVSCEFSAEFRSADGQVIHKIMLKTCLGLKDKTEKTFSVVVCDSVVL